MALLEPPLTGTWPVSGLGLFESGFGVSGECEVTLLGDVSLSVPTMSQPSLTMLSGCRHATGKAQHGNFLVAIKQEKGESARVGGEKPEEEVSPGACVPSHRIPESGAQGAQPGAVPAPLLALQQPM